MSNVNRNTVTMDLTDVLGRGISDRVEIKIVNQRVASLSQKFEVIFKGSPVALQGVPASPSGLAQVFFSPTKYRDKSIFIDVLAGGDFSVKQTFLLDPNEVRPVFPKFSDISTGQSFATLHKVLQNSSVATEAAWKGLDDQVKAGLLNLHAKMQREEVQTGKSVFDFIDQIVDFRPQRVFAIVKNNLIDLVRSRRDRFGDVLGTLHNFPDGFTRIDDGGSFKTKENAGNLQLTFAQNGSGQFMADIDIDDHQGVLHVADVLRHKITGKNTHPYNIHQVLVFIQDIDPGYQLV
jgi:hypothetical protein